jgi:hypothetical protein
MEASPQFVKAYRFNAKVLPGRAIGSNDSNVLNESRMFSIRRLSVGIQ